MKPVRSISRRFDRQWRVDRRWNVAEAACWNPDVIHSYATPFKSQAPGSPSFAETLRPMALSSSPPRPVLNFCSTRGGQWSSESIEEFHSRINDENLDIDENCVMVLKNCGPRGYPGMAEVGNMPLPPKLLRKGVTDMVRVSDARMSGTLAYGTVVLARLARKPRPAVTLALVRTPVTWLLWMWHGAWVIQLEVDDATLAARRAQWAACTTLPQRGWERLYASST